MNPDLQGMALAFATASGVDPQSVYLLIAGMNLVFFMLFGAWQVWRLFKLYQSKKIDLFGLKAKGLMVAVVPMLVGAFLVF